MESKLEPVKTRVPYQLTLVLNEEEIEGLRHCLGAIPYDFRESIKLSYPSLTSKEIEDAWAIQGKIFIKCADSVDSIASEKKRSPS